MMKTLHINYILLFFCCFPVSPQNHIPQDHPVLLITYGTYIFKDIFTVNDELRLQKVDRIHVSNHNRIILERDMVVYGSQIINNPIYGFLHVGPESTVYVPFNRSHVRSDFNDIFPGIERLYNIVLTVNGSERFYYIELLDDHYIVIYLLGEGYILYERIN